AQLAEIDALRPFAENAEQANALSAAAAGLRDRMRELSQQTSTFGIQAEDALRGFSDAVANAI
ncbi:MAG TPA: hypothetical protein DDZ68_04460, partial [Parvularcula sp.]|nr:hypothetical protein [Parvularcula sp.]